MRLYHASGVQGEAIVIYLDAPRWNSDAQQENSDH
jgi:hypothetical protein